jgi:hypothetical protein
MTEPRTPEQWQHAVDLAAAARRIEDCRMFGLIEGGPRFDVARCDDILERGKAMGIVPSLPAEELAAALVESINEETREKRKETDVPQR